MRLHLGSGSVFLRDWVNVDLPAPRTFLAHERPDLVEKYITTESEYYARHSDKTIESLRRGPLNQECVCDRYGSFQFLPVRVGEVQEILARHVFEHLSIAEAKQALRQAWAVLSLDGILRLDVPDHEETLRLFSKTHDHFYIRHLLGPRRGDYGFHMLSYTRDRLKQLVQSQGFFYQDEEPNIHLYPAFCLRFVKT